MQPLIITLGKRWGELPTNVEFEHTIWPVATPFRMEFFFPGEPKAKNQGFPAINWKTSPPSPYIAPDEVNKEHEEAVREQFLRELVDRYPQFIKVMPIVNGVVRIRIVALFTPSQRKHYPGRPHDKAPDDENIGKLYKDAVGGRQKDCPSLLYWDDCISVSTEVNKEYWDAQAAYQDPNYPQQPGVVMVVQVTPRPRDPKWLPLEEAWCPRCYRSDFIQKRAYQKHVETCIGNQGKRTEKRRGRRGKTKSI